MENKSYEDFIRGAEYRKTWSIAYFNSLNFAKDMLALELPYITYEEQKTDKGKQDRLIMWRDWAIEQHGKYYAENIAIVGVEGFTPKVVAGLDKAKEAYANSTSPAGK